MKVIFCPRFEREYGALKRRHHSLEDNIKKTIEEVEKNPTVGDQIPGVKLKGVGAVYKIRVRGDGKGKRGGFRLIYYYRTGDDPLIAPVTIYGKSSQADLPSEDIKNALEKAGLLSVMGVKLREQS